MNAPATGPTDQSNAPAWVRHPGLRQWVSEVAQLTKPDRVVWCDGSQAEYDRLCDSLVANGTFIRLSEKLRPDSFLARSHRASQTSRGRATSRKNGSCTFRRRAKSGPSALVTAATLCSARSV